MVMGPMPTNVVQEGPDSSYQSSQCRSKLTDDRTANYTPITTDVVATRVLILGGWARVVIDVAVLEYRESEV